MLVLELVFFVLENSHIGFGLSRKNLLSKIMGYGKKSKDVGKVFRSESKNY